MSSSTLKSVENYDVAKQLQNGDIDLALVMEKEDWSLPELNVDQLKREKNDLNSPTGERQSYGYCPLYRTGLQL